MHIGLVGLGKMGHNMRERLRRAGIEVTGYARHADVSDAGSLAEMVASLPTPRTVWIMVPVEAVTPVIEELAGLLDEGDLVIEGGNSRFTQDAVNAERLAEHGIGYLDCGVSGGVWGLDNGYGLMQAYAEGYELLTTKDIVTDVPGAFKAWSRGTVVRSWLLDLLVRALEEDADLKALKGYVNDSGEGRWTVEEAIANAVPMPVITAALYARFTSRQDDSPAMKAVAALRHQFGGHAFTAAGEPVPGVAPEQAAEAGPTSGSGEVS